MNAISPVQRMRHIASSALIGTDRSGGGADAASSILAQAAHLGAQARAGFKPPPAPPTLAPCPPETLALASTNAMAALNQILDDPDVALINEWAELAHAKHQRVDAATVPRILDWWAKRPDRQPVVFTVLGARGPWLASLNPEWSPPAIGAQTPAVDDDLWQTGKPHERAQVLAAMRRHDPARALELVRSTWQKDGADERRRFIEVLRDHPTMADEPFLESALDDKSKLVRKEAASALAHLPGSRLRARMTDHARAIIAVDSKRGLLKRTVTITLKPPATFDKAWERDGIEERPARGTGERAWWMQQILAAADLDLWTQLSGLSHNAVLDAIANDDFFSDAQLAMIQAACTINDPQWSSAIARSLLRAKEPRLVSLCSLIRGLPVGPAETLLLEIAAHPRFSADHRWVLMAANWRPWSMAFSTAALQLLKAHPPTKPEEAWRLFDVVEPVSKLIAPGTIDQFEQIVSAFSSDQPNTRFRKIFDRIRLRADMHKEFAL